MIRSLFFGLAALVALASQAEGGRNAGGALIVHTNDSVTYTATGSYCGVDFDDPGSCENANTRTDKDENTPAVIWFLAAFPTGSDPAVTGIQFGVDFNMPAGQGYVGASGPCGPNPQLLPTAGFPDTPGGALLGYGEAVADTLFPFFWFAVYGIDENSYFGTALNPGGQALFADDAVPPGEDAIENFGTVRWYATGSNDCPGGGGGDGPDSPEGDDGIDNPQGGGALDPNMALYLYRWRSPSYINVDFGHMDSDLNLDRVGVEHLLEDAAYAWTDLFTSATVLFNLINRGDYWYPIDNDGVSTVNWMDMEGPTESYAGTYISPDYAGGCWERFRDIDMRFDEHYFSTNLCWVACGQPHGYCAPDGNDWNIDVGTTAKHEWGHGAVGLGHYAPPDWNRSIMSVPWEVPPLCRQRNLGPVDQEYAQWCYEGLSFDVNEPDNDCWPTGPDLGVLWNLGDGVNNGWLDGLPGYIDVDIFQFHVGYAQDWWNLEFTVYHGGDEGAQYALDLYCDGWDRGSYSNFPGETVHVVLPAETGLWQAKVRTADGIISAPSPYGFEVFLSAPTISTEEPPVGEGSPRFVVNPFSRVASGSPLRHRGTLKLFDVGGREIWSRSIPKGVAWSEDMGSEYPSGIYFLRLTDGEGMAVRRLMVVK